MTPNTTVVGDTGEPEDDDIPGELRTIMYSGYSPIWETPASQRIMIYGTWGMEGNNVLQKLPEVGDNSEQEETMIYLGSGGQ